MISATPQPTPERPGARVARGRGIAIASLLLAGYAAVISPPAAASRPVPSTARLRLDPNQASAAELELLPGIGPGLASAILKHRASAAASPAFRRAEDLDAVHRIGPGIRERMRPYLRFSPDPDAPGVVASSPASSAPAP